MSHQMNLTERVGLHLGLSSLLLQNGAPFSMIQQQLIGLRGVINEVLADETTPQGHIVQLTQLLPESLAEDLAGDFVTPNDLSGLED